MKISTLVKNVEIDLYNFNDHINTMVKIQHLNQDFSDVKALCIFEFIQGAKFEV